MEIKLRNAWAEDLPAIHRLAEELRQELEITLPASERRFETCFLSALTDPHSRILIGEIDGKVQGYLSVWRRTSLSHVGPAAFIDDLIVSKEARGLGLGKALIQEAVRYAREWGCVEIEVSSTPENDAALGLYRDLGFQERGPLLEQDLHA
ncbi:MAG: GNAT family N-acetyltransferase [Chloroflexi bacterium]|nr:GNAT family N-acetyltransferase [Chloroflexota bacterium]